MWAGGLVAVDADNLGWLERPIAEFWANLKAALYCLRDPWRYRVQTEIIWLEDRGNRDKYGEPIYKERVTYIGVARQNARGHWEPIKDFFGKSKFE